MEQINNIKYYNPDETELFRQRIVNEFNEKVKNAQLQKQFDVSFEAEADKMKKGL